ncbi:AraC family transcriptional regulator [Enterococcus faecium]
MSELSGFSNSSYFCRKFREYFGTSPSAYRKKSTHNIPSF